MTDAVVILITAPSEESAETLARALVEERLAACVNLVPGVRSIYHWKGAIEDEREILCVVKTARDKVASLRARVLAMHPYQVPEILVLPVEASHPAYLEWLLASVGA